MVKAELHLAGCLDSCAGEDVTLGQSHTTLAVARLLQPLRYSGVSAKVVANVRQQG